MNFALEQAEFWKLVEATAIALLYLKQKKDYSENQIENVVAQKKKIREF